LCRQELFVNGPFPNVLAGVTLDDLVVRRLRQGFVRWRYGTGLRVKSERKREDKNPARKSRHPFFHKVIWVNPESVKRIYISKNNAREKVGSVDSSPFEEILFFDGSYLQISNIAESSVKLFANSAIKLA